MENLEKAIPFCMKATFEFRWIIVDGEKVLQQMYIEMTTGKQIWKDVRIEYNP